MVNRKLATIYDPEFDTEVEIWKIGADYVVMDCVAGEIPFSTYELAEAYAKRILREGME